MAGETNILQEFLVKLGFDVDGPAIVKLTAYLKALSDRLHGVDVALAGAIAGAITTVQSVASEANSFRLLGESIGSTGAAVEEYVDALGLLGISQGSAEQSLTDFSAAMVDAKNNMGRSTRVFAALGVSVVDAGGKLRDTFDVLRDVDKAFEGRTTGEKIRFAERLGLGPDYIKVIRAGLGGLMSDVKHAQDVVSAPGEGEAFFENAKRVSDGWRGLMRELNTGKMLFKEIAKVAAGRAFETLAKVWERLTGVLKRIRAQLEPFAREIALAMGNRLKALVAIGGAFLELLAKTVLVVAKAVTGLYQFSPTLFKLAIATVAVVKAWKLLNFAFLSSPVFWLAALAVVVALVVEDLATFLEGGKSVFGEMGNWGRFAQVFAGALAAIAAALVLIHFPILAIGAALVAVGLLAKVIHDNWKLYIWGIGEAVTRLKEKWQALVKWFEESSVYKFFARIGSGMKGAMSALGNFDFGNFALPAPVLGAASANSNVSVAQNTIINVNGAQSPQATASAVAGVQNRVTQNTARNFRPSVR